MRPEPANYLRAALEAVGLKVDAVHVEHDAPEAFGNLAATAQTSVGELKIIYDRAFYVEAQEPDRIADFQGKLVEALITAREG